MLKTHNPPLVETLAEVLETMAFISPVLIEARVKAPANPLLVRIAFTGPAEGAVEMVASEEFAVLLAANVLGSSAADAESIYRAGDAMKELVNVVCGALLAKLDRTSARNFEVGIPTLETFDATAQWRSFVGSRASAVFDADGHTVAVRAEGAV